MTIINKHSVHSFTVFILLSVLLTACSSGGPIHETSLTDYKQLENSSSKNNQQSKEKITLKDNKTSSNKKNTLNCTLTISPGDSFYSAFNDLNPGDTLCLNDGLYQQHMDIPSNIHVRAVHDGKAEIDGMSQLGEAWRGGLVQLKGNNSSVRGLRVHHAGKTSHTCHMSGNNNTMRFMSCSHAGSNKHKNPIFISGTGHLLEDSWAFGKGRYNIQCFKGKNITLRRNVARWDITTMNTPTEPNAAFSIYNCSNVTIENNISIDYAKSNQRMKFGADFYAPHNPKIWPKGNINNHFLGNYSINHALGNLNRRGMMFDGNGRSNASNNVIKDFTVTGSDFGIVIPSYVKDVKIQNCSFSKIDKRDINTDRFDCKGFAEDNVMYVNRKKTSQKLFPLKHQALIKADMCRSGERQSAWCSSNLTLSEYINSYLF